MRVKRQFRRFRGNRRIRGNQGTWFPILGSSWSSEGGTYYDVSTHGFLVTLNDKSAGPVQFTVPITRDYTPRNQASSTPIEEQPSLRDFTEGQDYILKRIVGQCAVFINSGQNKNDPFDPDNFWRYVKVTAGFYVARASDDDQTLPDLTLPESDPSDSRNSQNPWIWRRNWILANPANNETVATGVNVEDELSTNRNMDALIGPSIDTKSKRRVRREQRLWFTASAIGWDGVRGTVISTAQPTVDIDLDVRVFGKMVKAKNVSAF